MKAYVLIKTRAGESRRLVEQLKAFDGVKEAVAVYGMVDVVAIVDVPDEGDLSRLVMDKIQGIPTVEATQTLIMIKE